MRGGREKTQKQVCGPGWSRGKKIEISTKKVRLEGHRGKGNPRKCHQKKKDLKTNQRSEIKFAFCTEVIDEKES